MEKDHFNAMLTGVGGEGVLTAGVMIAKAAEIEGHYVRGVQFHGLSQRGGTIPTIVRFGDKEKIHSPGIMQGDADLIMSFEPLEAVRAGKHARKQKTSFVISEYPYMPVYGNLQDLPYPKMDEIKERLKPFAKEIKTFKADQKAKKKFGKIIYGNTILIGAAVGSGELPLSEKNVKEAIKITSPRETDTNLKAFETGLEMGEKKA